MRFAIASLGLLFLVQTQALANTLSDGLVLVDAPTIVSLAQADRRVTVEATNFTSIDSSGSSALSVRYDFTFERSDGLIKRHISVLSATTARLKKGAWRVRYRARIVKSKTTGKAENSQIKLSGRLDRLRSRLRGISKALTVKRRKVQRRIQVTRAKLALSDVKTIGISGSSPETEPFPVGVS